MECKILLIDDSHDDQFLFRRILSKSGIEAELVAMSTASKGLEMVKNSDFDFIFLDYHLPGMNGIDFLRELKKERFLIPVIMLTGQEDRKVIIQLMQEGAIDYISKNSLNADVLRLSIQNALNLTEALRQKKEAEKALIISENRLAEAQVIAHIGNWEYNFKTHQLFLSAEARKILDYNNIKNKNSDFYFLRFIDPKDIRKVQEAMKNKKNLDQHDLTFRLHTNRALKFIHAKGFVMKDDENNTHFARGTIQDISIVKQALQDTEKAKIGRKATTMVFGIAIVAFLISEALLDPFVDGLHTSLLIGLSFKGGLALFLKPIESFLERFMLSRLIV